MAAAAGVGAAALEALVAQLAAKVPTPGGGAAAAVAASLGAASGSMAAIYTTRKKDEETGVADKARALAQGLEQASKECLALADKDAEAYLQLQQTWKKDAGFTPDQVNEIQANALNVPVTLLRVCHSHANAVHAFIPDCNPNIRSDAYVSLHLLAGAARAAYQTALVNNPEEPLKQELSGLLHELARFEASVLDPAEAAPAASSSA
mmetsp:Transcript_19932/g.50399  ORF Transcript_19932/g.50399 Transcript_19932/m.50399 type:complete len:207 (+) Transcript_19932:100-720(+)